MLLKKNNNPVSDTWRIPDLPVTHWITQHWPRSWGFSSPFGCCSNCRCDPSSYWCWICVWSLQVLLLAALPLNGVRLYRWKQDKFCSYIYIYIYVSIFVCLLLMSTFLYTLYCIWMFGVFHFVVYVQKNRLIISSIVVLTPESTFTMPWEMTQRTCSVLYKPGKMGCWFPGPFTTVPKDLVFWECTSRILFPCMQLFSGNSSQGEELCAFSFLSDTEVLSWSYPILISGFVACRSSWEKEASIFAAYLSLSGWYISKVDKNSQGGRILASGGMDSAPRLAFGLWIASLWHCTV